MHIEFALALSSAIQSLLGSEGAQALGISATTDSLDMKSYGILEIDTCPAHVSGELTSNICFRISKAIGENAFTLPSGLIDPEDVARSLSGFFPSEKFSLEVGGRGYLNASATKDFRQAVVAAMIQRKWNAFFSGASVFRDGRKEDFQWDMDAAFARLRASEDPSALLLLTEEANASVVERRIMLLSLLSDAELDGGVYLKGLHGRQNTPWYLRRYFDDVTRYSTFLRELPQVSRNESECADELRPTEKLLLDFRHSLFMAARHDRPERFLSHLLFITRDFYRIFNDPRLRTHSGFPFTPKDVERLHALIGLGRDVVAHGVQCLFGPDATYFLP